MSLLLDKISKENINDKVPDFRVGDVVKVHVRIKEGEKERVQLYTGTVIAKDGQGATETFTVRRVSYGEGVERVFPIHSPNLAEIEIERKGNVRRAKLYYVRKLKGKKAKIT
ncbi:MAG: large subunit ribosomal protein L19 [Kiritimatiellia bacterium]|jgi:large subunit ribosomal protein L19